MEKIPYNDGVKQIAEEMARDYYTDFAERNWNMQSLYVKWRLEAARIAVARMAEAYREAFKLAAYGYGNHLSDETIDGQTNHFLFEYGLIPDKPE